MKKVIFINNPDLTNETAIAVYSPLYDSLSLRRDSQMFENDGKCAGASFWGIDKAKGNSFIPVDIAITEFRIPKIGENVVTSLGNIVTVSVQEEGFGNVIIQSTGEQSENKISKEILDEIFKGVKEFDMLIDAH